MSGSNDHEELINNYKKKSLTYFNRAIYIFIEHISSININNSKEEKYITTALENNTIDCSELCHLIYYSFFHFMNASVFKYKDQIKETYLNTQNTNAPILTELEKYFFNKSNKNKEQFFLKENSHRNTILSFCSVFIDVISRQSEFISFLDLYKTKCQEAKDNLHTFLSKNLSVKGNNTAIFDILGNCLTNLTSSQYDATLKKIKQAKSKEQDISILLCNINFSFDNLKYHFLGLKDLRNYADYNNNPIYYNSCILKSKISSTQKTSIRCFEYLLKKIIILDCLYNSII